MGFLRRRRDRAPDPSIYTDLRDSVISLDPVSAGINRTAEAPNVWGVVMDRTLEGAVATIVSLVDGTTSMYLSSGGGTIGAGEHPDVAAASIRVIRLAEIAFADFPESSTSDVPAPGRTALTLLTFAGLRRVEEDNATFENSTSKVSPVADAMQEVIDEISRAGG